MLRIIYKFPFQAPVSRQISADRIDWQDEKNGLFFFSRMIFFRQTNDVKIFKNSFYGNLMEEMRFLVFQKNIQVGFGF